MGTLRLVLLCVAIVGGEAKAEHEASAAAVDFTFTAPVRGTPLYRGLELAYDRPVQLGSTGPRLRAGGGLRTGFATKPFEEAAVPTVFPLEIFVRARFTAELGVWQPSAGPEIGLSGFSRLGTPMPVPGHDQLLPARVEQGRVSPVYLTFGVEPLRFRFGKLVVSALELNLGSGLAPLNGVARLHFGFLRLGYVL